MKAFRNLQKKGKTAGSRAVFLRFTAKPGLTSTRFAFIVSKKTAKSAVVRNRARRQAREAVRGMLDDIKPGFEVAVSLKPGFIPLSFQEKQKELKSVLRRAGLTRK